MAGLKRWLVGLFAAVLLGTQVWAAPLQNQLAGHPAPYLALHGQDPVVWQEWNADTIARAKAENKLLFVSVGYFACHWCHVMQRESYSDPAIAELLNRDFIPVKVDRELNGALDAALIVFAEQLNGVAGWPLNAFVTPEGYPVHALLYEPPQAFKTVLEKVAKAWKTQSDVMRRIAREAAPKSTKNPPHHSVTSSQSKKLALAFQQAAWSAADHLDGGFGRVSKFPMVAQLDLLLDLQAEAPKRGWQEFLNTTLDQMARLGLHDPVNGGFFRYTVDPDWRTPHFEKMLYDNAQLALLYHKAAGVLERPDYRDVAYGALDFMLTQLKAPNGGFMTSLSALDSQGREGGAYLWEPGELKSRLSDSEYALLYRLWELKRPSSFELGYLPMELGRLSSTERMQYQTALKKLQSLHRTQSVPKDDKISSGLNGLALSAFSIAGKGVPRFETAARELAEYILKQLMLGNELIRARTVRRVFGAAELDDYAYASAGLLHYAQVHGSARAKRMAKQMVEQAWKRFYSSAGWQREAKPLLATLRPEPALEDGAMPSASAKLIETSLRLGGRKLSKLSNNALETALPYMENAPFDHPSGVKALRAWRINRNR